jgi:hypothetical protein
MYEGTDFNLLGITVFIEVFAFMAYVLLSTQAVPCRMASDLTDACFAEGDTARRERSSLMLVRMASIEGSDELPVPGVRTLAIS